jgi:hypothetical protein
MRRSSGDRLLVGQAESPHLAQGGKSLQCNEFGSYWGSSRRAFGRAGSAEIDPFETFTAVTGVQSLLGRRFHLFPDKNSLTFATIDRALIWGGGDRQNVAVEFEEPDLVVPVQASSHEMSTG